MKHKILIIVVSAALLLGVLSLTAGATTVNVTAVDYYEFRNFGYTVAGELIDIADDAHIYDCSCYSNYWYDGSTTFLNDEVFIGSVALVDGMNNYSYRYHFSEDFYLQNPSVTFNSFRFSDSDDAQILLDDFWSDVTVLFDIDYDVYSSAYVHCELQFFDIINGYDSLSLDIPLGTDVGDSIPIVLVDEDGYIHVRNVFGYALGNAGIKYVNSDVPAIANFSLSLENSEVDYGQSIYVSGIVDDINSGDVDVWSYSVYDFGYDSGRGAGIDQGYDLGYNSGYNTGLDEGYDEGYNAGQSNAIFEDGVGGFLSDSVGGFIDAPIFGDITIGDLLLTVCGVGLFILFLKFFAGG